MKKTLIAIAALAATSAFAQSSVTITGNIESGYKVTNAQDNTADKAEIAGNNASTSLIKFAGTEDLGGGMKAQFVGVQLISATSGQLGNTAQAYNSSNWFNDEIWAGVSGGFGAIKLGAPNSAQHEAAGQSQPFGTAMGSGWGSSGVSRFGAGVTTYGVNQFLGGASANGRVVRAEKSVRYDTPVISGFTGSVVYAAKNDNVATALSTSNSNGFQEYGLKYSAGPLNVNYASTKVSAGNYAGATSQSAALAAGAAVLAANQSVKYTFLAANYTMGATTVYAGMTTAKTDGVTTAAAAGLDTKSSNVAVKYALTPMIDLAANYVTITDKLSAHTKGDQKLTGIGADYKFSKTTSAYVRAEDYKQDAKSTTANGVKTTAVGLRVQF